MKHGKYLAGDWIDGSGRWYIIFGNEDFPISLADQDWTRKMAINISVELWHMNKLMLSYAWKGEFA